MQSVVETSYWSIRRCRTGNIGSFALGVIVNRWQISASVGEVPAVQARTKRRNTSGSLDSYLWAITDLLNYTRTHARTRTYTRTHTQPWKRNAIKWLQRRSSTVRWKWPFIAASLSAAVLLTTAAAAAIPPRRASRTAGGEITGDGRLLNTMVPFWVYICHLGAL